MKDTILKAMRNEYYEPLMFPKFIGLDEDQQQVARETTACLIKLCVTCGQNYTDRNICAKCESDNG